MFNDIKWEETPIFTDGRGAAGILKQIERRKGNK